MEIVVNEGNMPLVLLQKPDNSFILNFKVDNDDELVLNLKEDVAGAAIEWIIRNW